MKVLNVGLVVVLLGVGLSCSMQAKTIVYNQSNDEIKVVAEIIGSPNWASFPEGSIRKDGGKYINEVTKPGIKRGASVSFSKDLSNVKKNWKVWAKVNGFWQDKPVLESGTGVTGGSIIPVKAYVTNTVDDETNEPVFFISFRQGW